MKILVALALTGATCLVVGTRNASAWDYINAECVPKNLKAECNAGYATCTVSNAICYYCDTNASETYKDCASAPGHFCASATGTSHDCGTKYRGACHNDGAGGLTCVALPTGVCGTVIDLCQ